MVVVVVVVVVFHSQDSEATASNAKPKKGGTKQCFITVNLNPPDAEMLLLPSVCLPCCCCCC